jgi:AcrR family transcriptional regulator
MGRKKRLPEREELVLASAAKLFSVQGYEKTTLDGIAAHAGVSKGSIYLEFPSKEEILFSLIERSKDSELVAMRRIANRAHEKALTLLKEMLVQHIGDIFDSVQQKNLGDEELLQARKQFYTRLQPFIEARLDLIESLLQRAQHLGEITTPLADCRRTAQLIMLALRAVRPPYWYYDDRLSLQRDAAEILELIMKGLR